MGEVIELAARRRASAPDRHRTPPPESDSAAAGWVDVPARDLHRLCELFDVPVRLANDR